MNSYNPMTILCHTEYGCRIGTITRVLVERGVELSYEVVWAHYGTIRRYSKSYVTTSFIDITLKPEDELYELILPC